MDSKRTTAQNAAISKTRHTELTIALTLSPGFSCQGKVGSIIDKYLLCEIIGKRIQKYYKTDVEGKWGDELNIRYLKAALKHFNAKFEKEIINDVFRGGEGIRGEKTARQLRNGYFHTLTKEDRKEIEDRYDELIKKIETFLIIPTVIFSSQKQD